MDFINIIGTLFDNSIEHVIALAHQIKDLRLNKNQQDINEDLYDQIRITKETKDKCKGYFDNYHSLNLNVPTPQIGDWAIVKNLANGKWYIYKCVVEGYWKETEEEYTNTINLADYAKIEDLKTINGEPVIGEGDIEINNSIADSGHDGLMSSESYITLLTIKNETIPQIREDIDHILALFGDEDVTDSIQAILDRYNQIAEFIKSLGDSDNGQILFDILRDIDDLKEFSTTTEAGYNELRSELTDVKDDNTRIHILIDQIIETIDRLDQRLSGEIVEINGRIDQIETRINNLEYDTQVSLQNLSDRINGISNTVDTLDIAIEETLDSVETETNRATAAEEALARRISQIENNPIPVTPADSVKHIFITQEEYDALESYEKDTLYFIIEYHGSGSQFGDTFPLIFA